MSRSRGVALTPERIRADHAAAILGIEKRTVQAMALRGELPNAAKIGGVWTFDEAALRNYIKERIQCPQSRKPLNTPTGAVIRYGRGSRLADGNIEKAYEQAMSKLRGRGSAK